MLLKDLRDDWDRHGRRLTNPALWALATYRYGRWSRNLPSRTLQRVGSKVYGGLALAVQISSGIEIGLDVDAGEELRLLHASNIKIHPEAVLGDRVSVMHDVTIGTNGNEGGAPVIGDDVFIGAGAKVLGSIRVGNGALIAANSLVITDVPEGVTMVGVPARASPFSGKRKAGRGAARRQPAEREEATTSS